MRPKKSELRLRAAGWSIAVGCAAGLTLTGCMNNPTRGLSASLSKDAAQAALAAEEKSTREGKDAALAQQDEKPAVAPEAKDATDVKLAGAEAPSRDAKKKVVQAKSVVEDPFAELAAAVDAAEKPAALAAKPAAEVKKPKSEVAASPVKPRSENKAPDFDVEAWLNHEMPPSRQALADAIDHPLANAGAHAKPSPFPEKKPAAAPVAASDNPFAENAATPPQQKPAAEPEWAGARVAAPPVREPREKLTLQEPMTANGPGQPAAARPVHPLAEHEEDSSRQSRQRIKALLSDAHTQEIRGELKAAYRSAIIASRLANEQNLTFGPGQEHPREYAEALASRIYQLDQAGAAARPRSPVETDEFVQAQSQPKAFNLQRIEEAPHPASLQPAAQPEPVSLPQIRPAARLDTIGVWLSKPEIEIAAVAPTALPDSDWDPRPAAPAAPRVEPPKVLTADRLNSHVDDQGGVEFAIAHTVTNGDPAAAPRGAQAPVAMGLAAPRLADPMQSNSVSASRGPLLVPPSDLQPSGPTARADVAWADVAQPELLNPADRPAAVRNRAGSRGRWLWGLAGLLAAAGSTVMGLRMTRDEEGPVAAAAESAPAPTATETSQAVEPARPLKIKRAA